MRTPRTALAAAALLAALLPEGSAHAADVPTGQLALAGTLAQPCAVAGCVTELAGTASGNVTLVSGTTVTTESFGNAPYTGWMARDLAGNLSGEIHFDSTGVGATTAAGPPPNDIHEDMSWAGCTGYTFFFWSVDVCQTTTKWWYTRDGSQQGPTHYEQDEIVIWSSATTREFVAYDTFTTAVS